MKILVTGAAGFIGSHLCQRLLARGDDVIGVDNFDPFYDCRVKQQNLAGLHQQEGFQFCRMDICDMDALTELWQSHCNRLDAVVHLAAKAGVRPSIEDPLGYERTNIQGTLALLRLVTAAEPRPRFIFASSSSVYGNSPKIPFSEEDNVDFPISPYGATKKAGELICHTYHHLYSLPVWCLRFFTVYGPRQRPDLAIHKFTAHILRGESIEMFGDGSSSRDYTYVDDILVGVVAAIDCCQGYEIINLGSEQPISLREMIRTIENVTGKVAVVEQLPMQPGDVNRTFADVAKAKRLLGYSPQVCFSIGVRRFVDWYQMQSG